MIKPLYSMYVILIPKRMKMINVKMENDIFYFLLHNIESH